VLAAGLQETGRARVFGEHSAGAALPSLFKALPTGDLFQYAVADVVTPHSSVLEGEGVTPDDVVLRTRADLAAGRDPVVEAARTWLNRERGKK
jgi:carboxyl-terminal processing protease